MILLFQLFGSFNVTIGGNDSCHLLYVTRSGGSSQHLCTKVGSSFFECSKRTTYTKKYCTSAVTSPNCKRHCLSSC